MCGICGVIDFAGLPEDVAERLSGMVHSLHHRGPDQRGTHIEPHAALGHARLSIIDLSEDGRQPMTNEDGMVWVVFNGEIYNFKSLRQELAGKGHRFVTRTDTEAIIHLYEQEGIDCVNRLRGMFAIAIWDRRARRCTLIRDRVGIKPLYYTVQGGRLIFGSEIKAILAHGDMPRTVRPDALSDYLTFLYVPAPKTMFEGIYKLPAGHYLQFDAAGAAVHEYWDLKPACACSTVNGASADRHSVEEELRGQLAEAVQSHLVSDVPLGAFLSGGVDSSAVVAMMAQAGQDPLITCSIGFPDPRYDELPHARRVAQQFKTDHHEQVVTPSAVSVVEKLAWHYDEPFADFSSIPTYYVSQMTRQNVTVALSGDGGDENFGGYRRYRFDLIERRVRRMLPASVRRFLVGPLAAIYPKADWLPRPLRAKSTLQNIATDAATAYCQTVGFLSDGQKRQFLRGDVLAGLGDYESADIIRHHIRRAPPGDLSQITYADIKTYLVDDILTKVDRASMAVSLEVRPPMLDHQFMEFAAGVPEHMKIDRDGGKSILKSALRPMLDDQTLYRPKQGFTPPIVEWLRGPLRDMAGDLLDSPRACYKDYLAADVIHRAWREHQRGLRNYGPLLWAVLVFELWHRNFVTADLARPAGVAS